METLTTAQAKDYWKGIPSFDDIPHHEQEMMEKAKIAKIAAKYKADRITPKQLKQILS